MLTGVAAIDRRFFARLLDDHLVVIDMDGRDLRVFNPAATALWLLLGGAVRTVADLVAEMAALFGDKPAIAADVAACLDHWAGLGWIERDAAGAVALTRAAAPPSSPDTVFAALPGEEPPAVALSAVSFTLRGTPLVVEVGQTADPVAADLVPRLHAVLSGFPPAASPAGVRLRLVVDRTRIWIGTPDGLAWTADPSDALGHLVMHLFLAGYPGTRLMATVHAAALGRGCGLVVMPGLSGCGKTTLTGYLAARGWSYAGDDIIAIGDEGDGGPPRVLPFTSALSVKPGSWPVLERFHPDLAARPLVPYADKLARFLPLPADTHPGADPAERVPRAIVFPRFDPAGSGDLVPISTLDCVLELVQAGFTTGLQLDGASLGRFFDLLEGLPRYRLSYSCLETAERCLCDLVS